MAFVMVLSWSRGVFVSFFYGSRMSAFLAGHVAAFEYFGGVCPLLLSLPPGPFPCAEQVAARAGKTPYVRFDRNDYSVPHTHVRRELVVVADLDTVRVVDGTAVLAEHARCYSAGEVIEAAAHVEALVAEKAAARAHHDVGRLEQAVPATRDLLRVLAERGEPLARAVRQLGELLDEYGPAPLQQTILDAMTRDLFHVPSLRHALERTGTAASAGRAELPARLRVVSVQPHDLRTYDALHTNAAEEDDDAEDA